MFISLVKMTPGGGLKCVHYFSISTVMQDLAPIFLIRDIRPVSNMLHESKGWDHNLSYCIHSKISAYAYIQRRHHNLRFFLHTHMHMRLFYGAK